MGTNNKPSEYLQYLPQIFREKKEGRLHFLGQYLKIYEALLSGRNNAIIKNENNENVRVRGLEEYIKRFEECLDSGLTPVEISPSSPDRLKSDFLDYLASWVALIFDQNWALDKKRQWLQKIVYLYKIRGTKSGLEEYLKMFVGKRVIVEEPAGGFIIGENSTIGLDTFIAGAPAYFFRVKINYGFPPDAFNINEWKNLRKGTRTIVDQEKPAHTYYQLHARTPGIIVGGPNHPQHKARSTIGKDTLIWKQSKII